MNFTKKQKHWMRLVGISLSIFLILFISLLITAYFLTPKLTNYKTQITQTIADSLQIPISVEKMNAKWQGLSPVIDLQDVILWNDTLDQALFTVKDLSIDLNIWDLLIHKTFSTNAIVIDNFSTTLIQNDDGSFNIKGLENLQKNISNESSEKWTQHLLQQKYIEMRNVTVNFQLYDGRNLILKNIIGKLNHAWGTVEVAMSGTLVDPINNPPVRGIMHVSATLQADQLYPKDWQGELNIELEQVDLPTWAELFPQLPLRIESGNGRLALWSLWNSGRPQLLQTSLALDDLSFTLQPSVFTEQQTLHWTEQKISGDLQWQELAEGWQLRGENISLTQNDLHIPATDFKIVHSVEKNEQKSNWQENLKQGHYTVHFTELDLDVVEQMIQESPVFINKLPAWWPLNLSGRLKNVIANIDQVETSKPEVELTATFENLGMDYHEKLNVGFKGLTGFINLKPDSGQLHIQSPQLQLQLPKIFTTGVELPHISSNIEWEKENEHWLITLESRSALFELGLMNITGDILLSPDIGNSEVNLQAEASNIPIVPAVAMYLPRPLLPEGTVEWLDLALKGGTVKQANMKWQGQIKDFPYTDGKGLFEVTLLSENAELKYHPEWPALESLNAQIIFRGDSFYANSLQGMIGGEQITKTVVTIPKISLKGFDLNIIGSVTGTAEKAIQFLQKTPLWKTLQNKLSALKVTGPIDIDIALNLPIYQENKNAEISGGVNFKQTAVNLSSFNLTFDHVIGQLHFDQSGIYADNLQAKLFGQAVTAQLGTQSPANQPSFLAMKMQGNIDIKTLQQQYKNSLWKNWQGITPFNAELEWHNSHDKKTSFLQIKSPLTGLSIDLPEPLNKTAQQTRPLTITTKFNETQNTTLQYGDLVNAEIITQSKQNKLNILRGTLNILSKQKPTMPQSGLQINVNFPRLEIKGNVLIPEDLKKSRINVNLDSLNVKTSESSQATADIDFPGANFPNFNINVKNVILNGQSLGTLSLVTKKDANALAFNSIKLNHSSYNVSAAGRWENGKMQTMSYLQGSVNSKNLGNMLKTFQLSQTMDKGTGKTSLDIYWVGSPIKWSLNNLQGSMKINWQNGHLTQVKPGLGRILSLFNVESLSRRLRLDFSDVFKKGFTFDTLNADVKFNQGVISTTNGILKSTSGEIDINGKAYASNKTLDLNLLVKPSLTGPLPIAATVASGGNPLVGALALAVDKAITPKITGGIAGMKYHVTGNWQDPKIEKIK